MPAYSIQMYRAYHHWTHLWLNFNMLRIWLWISKCVGLGFTFIPKLPKRNTFGHLDLVFVSYFLCWPVIINIHTKYAGLTLVNLHTGCTLYTCFNSNGSRLGTLTIKGYTAVAISPFFSSLKTKSKLSACFCHIYVFSQMQPVILRDILIIAAPKFYHLLGSWKLLICFEFLGDNMSHSEARYAECYLINIWYFIPKQPKPYSGATPINVHFNGN